MNCPNCRSTITPGLNEPTVTCWHCAATWQLTPSGHIRRLQIPPHALQMTREEREGKRA